MFLLLIFAIAGISVAQTPPRLPGELVWALGYDPKTFDPAKVDDGDSETVRFLTAGVLLRFNRVTQQVEPALAESWSLSPDGKTAKFKLRSGARFSDGTTLTSRDVAWSLRRVLLHETNAPVAQEFLEPSLVTVEAPDAQTVVVHLPKPVIGIGKVFDEVAIEPSGHPSEGRITSGPFFVTEYRRSQFVRLQRNPYYSANTGKNGGQAKASGIRLDIVENREQEIRRFERGEYDLIQELSPEHFELLRRTNPSAVKDLGASLNTEQLWFNQSPSAPLPVWEKSWFQNRAFRTAISQAINRTDLAHVVYADHATAAYSFISPVNVAWYNRALAVAHTDLSSARALLNSSGFHMTAGVLKDTTGHAVQFSILTNSGNSARLRMATLIQQDLSSLGIKVNVVTLDFPALVERLMHNQDYEACLLGLENVDPDPNAMMNLWLSSSENHQWNPSEKMPATDWEAEIDRLMKKQASDKSLSDRKAAVDRVQQIVADQQPFIYLVYPNTLIAVSPRLQGSQPGVLQPSLIWNAEQLHLGGGR